MLVGAPVLLVGGASMLEYVVRPGDTVSGIAQRHDTTVERIVARNGLHPSGDHVVSGQRLDIPAAHGPARADRSGRSGGSGISPDARRIVTYTVRPGDTPSSLAVRFHAWTAELIEMNGPVLRVGEQIKIPVVLAAVAEQRRARSGNGSTGRSTTGTSSRSGPPRKNAGQRRLERRLRSGDDPDRTTVRRVIERTAQRFGVDPDLALAVSWQEAGWQMHHVSYADAVGAMQVIPSTGRWMSDVVGRDLDLTDTRDNVTAGVALLKVLTDAAPERQAIAGYYQGLAGVRQHGMRPDTKRYVANVLALERQFEHGDYPA